MVVAEVINLTKRRRKKLDKEFPKKKKKVVQNDQCILNMHKYILHTHIHLPYTFSHY